MENDLNSQVSYGGLSFTTNSQSWKQTRKEGFEQPTTKEGAEDLISRGERLEAALKRISEKVERRKRERSQLSSSALSSLGSQQEIPKESLERPSKRVYPPPSSSSSPTFENHSSKQSAKFLGQQGANKNEIESFLSADIEEIDRFFGDEENVKKNERIERSTVVAIEGKENIQDEQLDVLNQDKGVNATTEKRSAGSKRDEEEEEKDGRRKATHIFVGQRGSRSAIAPSFNLALTSQQAHDAFGEDNVGVREICEEAQDDQERNEQGLLLARPSRQTVLEFDKAKAHTSKCFDVENATQELHGVEDIQRSRENQSRFSLGPWRSLIDWAKQNAEFDEAYNIDRILNHNLGDQGKVPFLAVLVEKVHFLEEGAMAVVMDETGEMQSEVHSAILSNKSIEFTEGAAVALRNVTVYRSHINREGYASHSLILTSRNIWRVFSPSTPCPDQFVAIAPNRQKERNSSADQSEDQRNDDELEDQDLLGWLSQNASGEQAARSSTGNSHGRGDENEQQQQLDSGSSLPSFTSRTSQQHKSTTAREKQQENSFSPEARLKASQKDKREAIQALTELLDLDSDVENDSQKETMNNESKGLTESAGKLEEKSSEKEDMSAETATEKDAPSSQKSCFNDQSWLDEDCSDALEELF